jgi:4-hydroxy-3-polyprenylbenzoate decarboxylase
MDDAMDDLDAKNRKKIVVAMCGASGAVYGIRLIRALMAVPVEVYLVISAAGRAILAHEAGFAHKSMVDFLKDHSMACHAGATLVELDPDDGFASIASGSFRHQGMVIAPCSMNTLAAAAAGITDNLIHRAADVCLKEGRPLILVPRETPLSVIHLQNMLRLARAGAVILPPSPGFYMNPRTIEDLVDGVVARILDRLGFHHDIAPRWSGPEA